MGLTHDQKHNQARGRFITFQQDIVVTDGGATKSMRPRTLEEAFAYQNFSLIRSETFRLGLTVPAALDDAYQAIYDHIKSSKFKKTDFAMDVLASEADWQVPSYIAEGLRWLENRLHPSVAAEQS
jgi:hypothetical protein